MNFFSTLRHAIALTTVVYSCIPWVDAATPSQVQQLLQSDERITQFDKKQKHYDTTSLVIFTWQLDQDTYRMVHNPNGLAIMTVRKKGQVAFSEIFRENIQEMSIETLKKHILSPEAETVMQSSLYDKASKSPDAQKGQELLSEDFSTSDVLSWNRLLNEVYKGNLVSVGGANSSGSATEEGDSQGNLDQATSMAKMMNQCGGQSKSNAAQKQAMQNVAQALVAASAASAHSDSIARASEGYTENTRDFEKGSQDSALKDVGDLTQLDLRQLAKSIQQAKRDIQKVLQSDFQQLASMQEGTLDQQSLTALRRLRQKHKPTQLQMLFSESSRNMVMSQSYATYFTQSNPPYVIWTKNRQSFVVNPFLQSKAAYRHALVQALILWEERF